VFMQSDLVHFQQRGVSGPNLAGGLCYSVVANYLNKVVEQRKIGETILFQGGTALNKGIVAAFEQALGKKILVPEHNEVTGAIGAALLAARKAGQESRFKGFDLSQSSYSTEVFECQGCLNLCEVRKIRLQGEDKPLYYGHRCEKYERDRPGAVPSRPDLVRERERIMEEICPDFEGRPEKEIGIPRALFLQEWFPFFSSLFQSLGYAVVLSERTNKKLTSQGASLVVTETCLPIKAAHGHVRNLIDKGLKRIFLPQISELPGQDQNRPGKVCPYVQGLPWTIRAAYDFKGQGIELLSPVLHLGRGRKGMTQEWKSLARSLGCGLKDMEQAVARAWEVQTGIMERFRELGREFLQDIESGEKAVLIVGRPYNALDPGMNMDLSQKLKKLGIPALPLDFLPREEGLQTGEMYWAYGQKILAAGELLRQYPNLYPVFVTNFSCGPDAFILHFFQKQIGARPFLELEIDEHTADAGILTRLEAFWDSIPKDRIYEFGSNYFYIQQPGYKKDLTLYLPNMCDHLHPFAAALNVSGVRTRMCPPSDDETMYYGRTCTKGKECLPAVITTGDMVKATRQPDFDPERSAFFMPAAGGPCRFGLYHLLHRLVLDQVGLPQVAVYAPSQSFTLYEDLGILGSDFSKIAWQGVVAVDFLTRFVQETKPYAADRAKCTQAYTYYLSEISRAVSEGRDLLEILSEASAKFRAMRVRDERKPVVGIVGEIYVRSNPFANEYLVQNLENFGVEAWLPSIGEWIHYMNHTAKLAAWREREGKRWLKMALEIVYQNRIEKRLARKSNGWLRSAGEPKTRDLLNKASPYIHKSFEGEAILSIGKSLDYMEKGVDGIINVMPFTCMPGGVVDAVFRSLKKVEDIPMMSLTYDGQTQTNTGNRLEAFV
ncbi:MAG: acyl-CoA dehydratase activase-related protein, partial [Thermodesulfobacteriota bacterium]